MNIKLNVINLSHSSDESDLYEVLKQYLQTYFQKNMNILKENFNTEKNKNFIQSLYETYNSKKEIIFY